MSKSEHVELLPSCIIMDFYYGLHLLQLGQTQLWETLCLFQPFYSPCPPLSLPHIPFDAQARMPMAMGFGLTVSSSKHTLA